LTISALPSLLAQAGDTKPIGALPMQFAATAFSQSGGTAGKSFGLTIYVTGWTTDEQLKEGISTLKSKGQDALVSYIDKSQEVGRISPTGSVGTELRFARVRHSADGGLHILLATNRNMSFLELRNDGRSTDYPFTVLSLDIDKNGKGTGKLAAVVKVKFNKKGQLEVENYGEKPFRLANVYLQK
jgi:hypothetical protein